jgi:phage terminase large subunit-like protein
MSPLSADRLKKLELLKRRDPAAWRELVELIFEVDRRELKERYQDSFLEFVRRAWQEVDPAPLKLAWFHEVIIEHLEAIAVGNLRSLIINAPPRTGKALACGTPILTTWGWKEHGALTPGDFVYGADGAPKRVLAVTPRTVQRVYRVRFDDGCWLIASAEHLWRIDREGKSVVVCTIDLCTNGSCPDAVAEPLPLVPPFKAQQSRRRYVRSVERVEDMEANCIQVEGDVYMAGESLIPTHNSLLVSVMYPAWIWCRSEIAPQSGPQVSFFCVSYSATLAEELAVKMRRLVFGAWYQGVFGNVKMLLDQSSRANFGNTAGGQRISSSIESGLLGRGGDCHVYDDLMTVKEAESDLERQSILRAFSEGLPTRITNPQTSARILVGQRVSEDDPTNLAIETWTDAVHLMFPARYEPERSCVQDRRTYEGELLWPEVWPEQELRKVELGLAGLEKGQAGLSSYAAAAQLQQAPIPRGGGVIPRTDWRVWPEKTPDAKDIRRTPSGDFIVELPEVSFVICAVDTAFSEKETADFSACVVLGVWSRRREEVSRAAPWYASRWSPAGADQQQLAAEIVEAEEQPRVCLMEAWQTRAGLNVTTVDAKTKKPIGLVPRLLDTCRRRHVDRIIVENANRGHDTAQELQRQMNSHEFQIEMFEPSRHGSKLNRMYSVSPLFSQNLIYAPANLIRGFDKYGRETVTVQEFRWVAAVLDQCLRTPRGKQDLADCVSMGLIYLRTNGFLELHDEFIKNELAARVWKPKPRSIGREYGVG